MVCAQVIGNDATVAVAGASGSFELNVMMPVMARNLLESIRLLAHVTPLLADRCVDGIEADRERMLAYAESSPSVVTPLNKHIGYEEAAKVAKAALKEGRTIREQVLEMGYVERGDLTEEELDAALDVRIDDRSLTGAPRSRAGRLGWPGDREPAPHRHRRRGGAGRRVPAGLGGRRRARPRSSVRSPRRHRRPHPGADAATKSTRTPRTQLTTGVPRRRRTTAWLLGPATCSPPSRRGRRVVVPRPCSCARCCPRGPSRARRRAARGRPLEPLPDLERRPRRRRAATTHGSATRSPIPTCATASSRAGSSSRRLAAEQADVVEPAGGDRERLRGPLPAQPRRRPASGRPARRPLPRGAVLHPRLVARPRGRGPSRRSPRIHRDLAHAGVAP